MIAGRNHNSSSRVKFIHFVCEAYSLQQTNQQQPLIDHQVEWFRSAFYARTRLSPYPPTYAPTYSYSLFLYLLSWIAFDPNH